MKGSSITSILCNRSCGYFQYPCIFSYSGINYLNGHFNLCSAPLTKSCNVILKQSLYYSRSLLKRSLPIFIDFFSFTPPLGLNGNSFPKTFAKEMLTQQTHKGRLMLVKRCMIRRLMCERNASVLNNWIVLHLLKCIKRIYSIDMVYRIIKRKQQ